MMELLLVFNPLDRWFHCFLLWIGSFHLLVVTTLRPNYHGTSNRILRCGITLPKVLHRDDHNYHPVQGRWKESFVQHWVAHTQLTCSSLNIPVQRPENNTNEPNSQSSAIANSIVQDRMSPLWDALQNFVPSTDAARVFHGRGELFPGLEHITIDYYPPVWLVTIYKNCSQPMLLSQGQISNKKWNNKWSNHQKEEHLQRSISSALQEKWMELNQSVPLTWILQDRSVSPAQTHLVEGCIPDPHIVQENGNMYLLRLQRGQNHGLFLDMANGREWVQQNSLGKLVLNLFSYTCSFSVAALRGGAAEVVNIDMSKGALKIGQQNHHLNNLTYARFLSHDIFKSWGKLKKLGPYQLIVCDPPSYQKGSFVAAEDYGKIIRRFPSLLSPGGHVLLCLNAPELGEQFLQEQVTKHAPGLVLVKRLKNPNTFPVAFPSRALKVLLYHCPESDAFDC